MKNLRLTGKVITHRKGHISLCWLFNARNKKFEANFGNVGLIERAGGRGGGCCMGAMKYAYGFCISWMSVLCMISSLRVATLCHGNNHNHRPWLKTLYVARVSSTQASCSCKAKSILLPESNSSSFYTQI